MQRRLFRGRLFYVQPVIQSCAFLRIPTYIFFDFYEVFIACGQFFPFSLHECASNEALIQRHTSERYAA